MSKQPPIPEAVEEVQRILKEHDITAVALERAFTMYDNIAAILLRYKNNLSTDEAALIAMEKEMVVLFAKEIDRNFYEGMLESVVRSMSMVASIPKVKKIQQESQAKIAEKLAASNSPEANKVKELLNKILGNPGVTTTGASVEGSAPSGESLLDSFGMGRVKKEDLN